MPDRLDPGRGLGSCTSPKSYSNLSEGAHKFEVRAIDTAGNVDQSPASFSWTVDTAAPSTTIDSSPPALSNAPRPASPSRAATPAAPASPPSNAGSTRPGRGLGALHLAAGLREPARRRPFIRGPRDRHRRQRRPDPGHASAGSIDTAAPTTNIDSSPPALSNSASASFAFSGTDAGGSGVASFECRRDGASFAPCTSPQAYAALADGAHSFEVRAIDTAGNADQTRLFSWTSTPPRRHRSTRPAGAEQPPPPASPSRGPTPAAPGRLVRVPDRRDPAAAGSCPRRRATRPGRRRPFIRGPRDRHAGNVDQTPASFSWTIDTAAPTTTSTRARRR